MVRINKNLLEDKVVKSLYKQLDKVLGELPPDKISVFLNGLIGPEERLMLAKRLAVIVMLKEGYSSYRIAETLKLSQSTIKNIQARRSGGAYVEVTKTLKNHLEAYRAILDIVDSLLHVGNIMPHRVGLDRYKGIRH